MSDKTELLPCPFCGGKASHRYIETYSVDSSYFVIGCNGCDAQMPTDENMSLSDVLAWNERVTPEAPRRSSVQGAAPAVPPAAQPIGWLCEDLILSDSKPLFTHDREHAERRAELMHEGKPAWRVTPVYAAPSPKD